MMIRRDDLAAAAAVGLLQYRQIDPLLVFLLQRDVLARRAALVRQVRSPPLGTLQDWLSYMAGLLAIVTVALFALLFASRAVQSFSMEALFLTGLLYALVALRIAVWCRKHGYYSRMRVVAALALASLPIAVIAVHQVTG